MAGVLSVFKALPTSAKVGLGAGAGGLLGGLGLSGFFGSDEADTSQENENKSKNDTTNYTYSPTVIDVREDVYAPVVTNNQTYVTNYGDGNIGDVNSVADSVSKPTANAAANATPTVSYAAEQGTTGGDSGMSGSSGFLGGIDTNSLLLGLGVLGAVAVVVGLAGGKE